MNRFVYIKRFRHMTSRTRGLAHHSEYEVMSWAERFGGYGTWHLLVFLEALACRLPVRAVLALPVPVPMRD